MINEVPKRSFISRSRHTKVHIPSPNFTAASEPSEQSSIAPRYYLKLGKQVVNLPTDGKAVDVGRAFEADIEFNDEDVSRRHAQFRVKDGTLEIKDVGSTNGTTVNDKELEPKKWHRLERDARVKLAAVSLQWGEGLAPEAAATPATETLVESNQSVAASGAGQAVGGPVGVALTLAGLKEFAKKTELEPKEVLMASLGQAKAQMSKTSGIVELPKNVPTMVIPDIHAQRDYLTRALEHKVDGVKVFDLVKAGKMNLLCLGDGMHSEGRGYKRWMQAEQDYLAGRPSEAMKNEVVESFGTMKMVMDLKTNMGDNFQYLRGNHDDINPEHGYRKYTDVGESDLMRSWVTDNYGQDLLQEWASFEESMPLVAKGSGFVASHAAPGTQMRKQEITDRSPRAKAILNWSDNTKWKETGQRRDAFEHNLESVGADPGDKWFIGHRKVEDANYRGQFDQQLIQINPLDSDGFVVAMIGADGSFDPEKDTFEV